MAKIPIPRLAYRPLPQSVTKPYDEPAALPDPETIPPGIASILDQPTPVASPAPIAPVDPLRGKRFRCPRCNRTRAYYEGEPHHVDCPCGMYMYPERGPDITPLSTQEAELMRSMSVPRLDYRVHESVELFFYDGRPRRVYDDESIMNTPSQGEHEREDLLRALTGILTIGSRNIPPGACPGCGTYHGSYKKP